MSSTYTDSSIQLLKGDIKFASRQELKEDFSS